MTARDGRIIASENEIRVLRALHRFGWLRTKDLAALLWQPWSKRPTNELDLKPPKPTASGLRMAQRTLRRLLTQRQLLRTQAPDGSWVYTLSEAGARRLQQIGVPATTGKDLIRVVSVSQYRHRCISNEVAIRGILSGFRVSSEREIACDRWLGGSHGIARKRPDVLLVANHQVYWFECERSRKNARDHANLIRFMEAVIQDVRRGEGSVLLGAGVQWAKIVFVCTLSFETRLRQELVTGGWKKTEIEKLIIFETCLYSLVDLLFV